MSKVYLFIFILPNFYINVYSLNVGTVLYNRMDIYKPCWSVEELAALTSRLIFEDLLPAPEYIRIESDDYIDEIVCYFKEIIEMIGSCTESRNKHIALLAITDLIGGYIQHIIYPNAKYAYYSGVIKFTSVFKIKQLYDELKWFLRTNGEGWAKETENVFEPEIKIIDTSKNCTTACDRLIYYDFTPIAKREIQTHSGENIVKRSVPNYEIFFPLPFFDSKIDPSAIAIPFAHYTLRNIESRKSTNLIFKYFMIAHRCVKSKNLNKKNIERFLNNLYSWIEIDVLPKLHDEKLYAAFGSILRVQETLKCLGATEVELTTDIPEEAAEAAEDVGMVGVSCSKKKSILFILLICILIWFLLAILFICYKMKKNKPCPPGSCVPSCECPSSNKSNGSKSSSDKTTDSSKSFRSSDGDDKKTGSSTKSSKKASPKASSKASIKKSQDKNEVTRSSSVTSKRSSIKKSSATLKSNEIPCQICTQSGSDSNHSRCACAYYTSVTSEPNYDTTEKPRIFGYDFHTTSSESDDEEFELDMKTTTVSSTQ